MKNWQKAAATTLVTLIVGGTYLFTVWEKRRDPGVIGRQQEVRPAADLDKMVVMREFFPHYFEDTLRLEGTTVWMKSGYTMSYYPYTDGRVEFGKRIGVIPAAERMEVKKIIKAVAPAEAHDGIEPGGRQAFAVFTLKGGAQQYATAIGVMKEGREAYFCDNLFFYDDPHTIYDHWTKSDWAAIDQHQVKLGMSEMEVRMAIGKKMQVDSRAEGERTVSYDQDGKKWAITFVKDRAVKIE